MSGRDFISLFPSHPQLISRSENSPPSLSLPLGSDGRRSSAQAARAAAQAAREGSLARPRAAGRGQAAARSAAATATG